jgi:flagellar hook-associated protein 3 FlgL
MTLASELRMVQKQATNLKTTRDWLAGTDDVLSNFGDLMTEASSLALRSMNDTFSENERAAMAAQIGEMVQSAISLANTQQGGNYLFSGQQIKTQPFALQADAIIYSGDNATISHMVEIGQTMPVNVTGVAGNGGGIFNILTQLHTLQKSMAMDDKAGIQLFLDNVEAMTDDLHTAHSAVGVRMQRVDTTSERLTQRETALKHLYSQLVDADMAQVIAEMTAEERAYEMSLATTARVMPRSLLDFLR